MVVAYSKTEADSRFVSLKDCADKKQKFIDRDLCEAKESAIKEDVAEIKEDVAEIKEECRVMRENHLAHMQISLQKMERKLDKIELKFAMIASIAVFVIDLAIRYLFK